MGTIGSGSLWHLFGTFESQIRHTAMELLTAGQNGYGWTYRKTQALFKVDDSSLYYLY